MGRGRVEGVPSLGRRPPSAFTCLRAGSGLHLLSLRLAAGAFLSRSRRRLARLRQKAVLQHFVKALWREEAVGTQDGERQAAVQPGGQGVGTRGG